MTQARPSGWRVVYFGTPQVAVPPLEALCRHGHEVSLVVTRPAKRRGRRGAPTPSPVAAAAAGLGLAITSDPAEAVDVEADLGVVVAYGELIDDELLARRRTVNLHFSLLPRWRGAAPVERAILAGDTTTGVCLMDVTPELDAGAVYGCSPTPIGAHESADELRDRLCQMGIELLLGALNGGFGEPVRQRGEPTWAAKISPGELRIDWTAPAEQVLRQVRVGGAWTTRQGRRLKVLEARLADVAAKPGAADDPGVAGAPGVAGESGPAGEPAASGAIRLVPRPVEGVAVTVAAGGGAVELVTVQTEGRAATSAQNWIHGARITGGERLGE